MDRWKHLQWAKDRALEISARGDYKDAFTSMASDLSKHKDTEGHLGIELGLMMLIGGHLNSQPEMDKFINGFN